MTEDEQRAHVIAVAREFIGTPFHDNAGLKHVGCDCAHFLGAVYTEAGFVASVPIERYSPQFMLHSDEELFMSYVLRYAHEIDEADVKPADIVLYRVGRSFAHGAIIIDWPTKIIHAYKQAKCVIETSGLYGSLGRRKKKFFSPWS